MRQGMPFSLRFIDDNNPTIFSIPFYPIYTASLGLFRELAEYIIRFISRTAKFMSWMADKGELASRQSTTARRLEFGRKVLFNLAPDHNYSIPSYEIVRYISLYNRTLVCLSKLQLSDKKRHDALATLGESDASGHDIDAFLLHRNH